MTGRALPDSSGHYFPTFDPQRPERQASADAQYRPHLQRYPDVRTYVQESIPERVRDGPLVQWLAKSLRDTGPSDPGAWWNGYDKQAIHCVVHIYGITDDALAGLVTTVSQAAQANSVSEILPLKPGSGQSGRLEQYAPLENYIHFGYKDEIDNPGLGWPSDPANTAPDDANNFLIGYPGVKIPSGTGIRTGRRICQGRMLQRLPCALSGCRSFRSVSRRHRAPGSSPRSAARKRTPGNGWRPSSVGRWRNGSPLVLSPHAQDDATADKTDFLYASELGGLRCPFSAHSRVSNPRNKSIFATGVPVPRLVRRGMPYGAPPAPPDYDGERGLIGLFLCGTLAGQFEKLYSWINVNDFSKVYSRGFDTQDALLANRASAGDPSFTIPLPNGASIRIASLPQFIVTRGQRIACCQA